MVKDRAFLRYYRYISTLMNLGGAGTVVENTPEAFEQAFKELISNPQLRRELGEKARQRALQIDGEIMERKEAELYRQLIERA